MCQHRYWDVIAVVASLLVGVILTILSLFNVIAAVTFAPVFALVFGVLCVAVYTYVGVHAQAGALHACVRRRGRRLLISAFWLTAIAVLTLLFALTGLVIGFIISFVQYSLGTYAALALYCFLRCLTDIGCGEEAGGNAAASQTGEMVYTPYRG